MQNKKSVKFNKLFKKRFPKYQSQRSILELEKLEHRFSKKMPIIQTLLEKLMG